MWLSSQGAASAEEVAQAELGTVSIPGVSVFVAGERRNVRLFAPGGYFWKPEQKENVLLLPCKEEEGFALVAQELAAPSQSLAAGEVLLSVSPVAGICLRRDGSIHLTGKIFVNGLPLVIKEEASGGGGAPT